MFQLFFTTFENIYQTFFSAVNNILICSLLKTFYNLTTTLRNVLQEYYQNYLVTKKTFINVLDNFDKCSPKLFFIT